MNILILNGGRGWGGIESHSVTLASSLAKKGHKVIIGCMAGGSVMENAARAGLATREIKVVNSGDVAAVYRIVVTSKKEGIEIIVANLGKEYWPSAVAAKILGTSVVFVRHQVDILKKITAGLINRHVDKVAAVSRAVEEALIKSGISGRKIEVVYNAVDLERFNPLATDRNAARKELGFEEHDIIAGTAGKINQGKGVFELLTAAADLMKRYPLLKLLFVGDGPDRTALEKKTQQLSIGDRVVFTGLRKEMESMYAAMDIFVLPSTCREAFGMVIIEAMAMGKPVIATEIGGIPEIVKHGTNGILVKPGDPHDLAVALSLMIEDKELSSRIATEGSSTVSRYFSEKALGDAFERMMNKLKPQNR